ncbi:MAG: hypothetical protein AAGA83_15145 [Cyanobacteria bacterium P01_F01_bin.116]
MELIIHRLCNDDQANPQEKPIRMQWTDRAPMVGQLVSMGGDRLFEIAHVYTYKPVSDSSVDTVYMVFNRLPDTCSEPSEWDCWQFKELMPEETFHVELEDIGLPDLSYEINYLGEAPKLGKPLYGGTPTGDGSRIHLVRTEWISESYDAYNTREDSPCAAVYLTWCKRMAMEGAIAA